MKQTRPAFTHDALLQTVKHAIEDGLKAAGIKDNPDASFSNIDCIMAGLAVFTFKFPSLLKFDEARQNHIWAMNNLTQSFQNKYADLKFPISVASQRSITGIFPSDRPA